MREKRDRAYGPYKHRDKWRVVVIGADGIRTAATYASKARACERIVEVNEETSERTVSDAIDAYMATSTAKMRSKATVEMRLRGITGDGNRLLRKLTPRVASELFEARASETSGDTQFHELASIRAFMKWCIKKGWIKADPYAELKPTKARKRGKKQLRINEARKLFDACLAEDTKAATAVAVALLFGMRASSITNRLVRDLDDGGRVLWIEDDKTESGNRALGVPDVLRERLLQLAAGRPGDHRLFVDTNRDWLRYNVRRLCRKAGVPVVCPHGLRGTHASLARPYVPVEQVALTLGHAGPAVTRAHYLRPGLEQELDQRAVAGKLLPEFFPQEENPEQFS